MRGTIGEQRREDNGKHMRDDKKRNNDRDLIEKRVNRLRLAKCVDEMLLVVVAILICGVVYFFLQQQRKALTTDVGEQKEIETATAGGEVKKGDTAKPTDEVATAKVTQDAPSSDVKTAQAINDEPSSDVKTAQQLNDTPTANVETANEDKPQTGDDKKPIETPNKTGSKEDSAKGNNSSKKREKKKKPSRKHKSKKSKEKRKKKSKKTKTE
ncbi:hypothetical protein DICVIV_12969 [Dictyocaulus viviparus]|uniref:Uncharacterized protein n=1 Tax=Dictyocaulus viviparus TaxID=29172 RepID=A0A0D8XBN2_DICVI|nr:hypothetical protein DICVIV_12969 [Dictyocaulus viviparus]